MEVQTLNDIEKLQNLIQNCKRCSLYQNGRAMPYINLKHYKGIVFLLEAPGFKEVEMNTPVVGKAGIKLWSIAEQYNLYREYFAIINSVNCRPVKINEETKRVSNGKPTQEELKSCYPWLEVFIKLLNPKLIVAFGSYAIKSLLYEDIPVKSVSGEVKKTKIFNKYYEILCSVHPSSLRYGEENIQAFHKAMKRLGEINGNKR